MKVNDRRVQQQAPFPESTLKRGHAQTTSQR